MIGPMPAVHPQIEQHQRQRKPNDSRQCNLIQQSQLMPARPFRDCHEQRSKHQAQHHRVENSDRQIMARVSNSSRRLPEVRPPGLPAPKQNQQRNRDDTLGENRILDGSGRQAESEGQRADSQ
jgi:hypothetical protein